MRVVVIMSAILEKIASIELEMSRTQKNKATENHLGSLRAKLAQLRRELIEPSGKSGGKGKGTGKGEAQGKGTGKCKGKGKGKVMGKAQARQRPRQGQAMEGKANAIKKAKAQAKARIWQWLETLKKEKEADEP